MLEHFLQCDVLFDQKYGEIFMFEVPWFVSDDTWWLRSHIKKHIIKVTTGGGEHVWLLRCPLCLLRSQQDGVVKWTTERTRPEQNSRTSA